MYMANLWPLVCCHELFSTLAKTNDLCSFILNSLVDTCHWMGEFYYSSNSERGWDKVTLIAMPRPRWIHNDVGYLHTSGKKNIIFDMENIDIQSPFHTQQ